MWYNQSLGCCSSGCRWPFRQAWRRAEGKQCLKTMKCPLKPLSVLFMLYFCVCLFVFLFFFLPLLVGFRLCSSLLSANQLTHSFTMLGFQRTAQEHVCVCIGPLQTNTCTNTHNCLQQVLQGSKKIDMCGVLFAKIKSCNVV